MHFNLEECKLELEAQATIERYLDQIDPAINQQRYARLFRSLSKERIDSYAFPNEPLVKTIARYRRDVRLRAEISQAIHYLEVPLRNHLNEFIGENYGANWMLSPPPELLLSKRSKKKLTRIIDGFDDEQKQKLPSNYLVSRTTFGFWVNLFHTRYYPSLWHKSNSIATIFPYLPSDKYDHEEIFSMLKDLQELRNWSSHQGSLWNKPKLLEEVSNCRMLIHGIDPDALTQLDLLDRFVEVWQEKI